MTLDEFVAEELERIRAFKRYWRRKQRETQNTEDESVWSEEGMGPGDWDEQIRAFGD